MTEKHINVIQELKWSIGLGILALLFHAYFILDLWGRSIQLFGDAVHYDHSAVLLLTKHVYTYWSDAPAAQVTPGYPLFLEFAYWLTLITSHNHQVQMHVAATLQHIIAALTIVVVYRISRYFMPIWASALAAILWLIYPPVTWAASQLLTETLYVFFLVLFTWSFLFALRKKSFWAFVLSGFLLGILTLVRPSVLPLIAAPLLLLLQRQSRSAVWVHIRNWFGYLCAFVITMLPWWIRNVLVMHHFILTDDDMGNPLLFGSDPNFRHDPNLSSGLTPTQQEHEAIQRIIHGFEHQPWTYLKWYTIDKLGLLFGTPWYVDSIGRHAGLVTRATYLYAQLHIVFVVVGVIGLILGFWKPYLRWLSLLALFLIVVQLPFIPINRYVFPVMVYFMIGTAYFVYLVTKRRMHRRTSVTN